MFPVAALQAEEALRLAHDHLADLRYGPHWGHADRFGPSRLEQVRAALARLTGRLSNAMTEVEPGTRAPRLRDYPYPS